MFFKKEKINKYNKKGLLFIVSFFIFLFTSFIFTVEPVYAQMVTTDPPAGVQRERKFWYDKIWDALKWAWEKGGSAALQTATRNALNKIAFDTATWVGSAGKGKKPLFVTESWGKYLDNIGDQAAGEFIERLGRKWNFNLCEPDFNLKMQIGLGLVQQVRPRAPDCTFKEMLKNWDEELNSPDFLSKFQTIFDPAQNDLGIAFYLQTGILEEAQTKEEDAERELTTNKGWLDLRNIAGKAQTSPGEAEKKLDEARTGVWGNIGKFTGNALIDAMNVFLNQLAITSFNTALLKLGQKSAPSSSPYTGNYGGLSDYEGSPTSVADKSLVKLLEPKFDTRADYNILAELSMCSAPSKAGPTNCVIDEGFRQAIEQKKTVGEAIDSGYLKDLPFGFKISGSSPIEPNYNQGYPYRSMLILTKYRILPVGWRLAAEYIRSNPHELKNATLTKMVACFDPDDGYEGYNDDGNAPWCQGLVDPNWVLKASQNFCAKKGYGPEIVSDEISDDGEGNKKRTVLRNDNYCADEQSCIKEKSDGSCEAYGYCTEERRSWHFDTENCEPKYNTCQTFRSSDGQTFSYLENTLDYGICSVNNVGCKQYSKSSFSYNSVDNSVSWDDKQSIYFDEDVVECDEASEGCHGFIRTKSGFGTNLVVNSDFESGQLGEKIEAATSGAYKLNNWPIWLLADSKMSASIVGDAPDRGGKVFHFAADNSGGGLYSYDSSSGSDNSVIPKGFAMEPGVSYTLSAYVYLVEGDRVEAVIGNKKTRWEQVVLKDKGVWKRVVITINNDDEILANEFHIYSYSASGGKVNFYVDNIQLEIDSQATDYKGYGVINTVYEKLAPAYLNCNGANPPARCDEFIKTCKIDEVGCGFYTSTSLGMDIPAKTTISDYCPNECVGFDTYVQSATNFANNEVKYFIPKSAKTCGADAVGCEEFTNLDAVAKGGEGREYYSYLRKCIKPNDSCAEFYTWEGSDENGYQLEVFNLQASGGQPKVTSDDSLECSEAIYNLPGNDPAYNSDCRQFYNKKGGIFYHLYTKTISCSENCHPYRRTVDSKIYMAIPGEGESCAAGQNGCREYSGNKGNNMKIVLNDNFNGSAQEWSGSVVNEALMVGGNSLAVNRITEKVVNQSVQKGRSYVLNFIAKKKTATKFSSIKFINGSGAEEKFIISSPNKSLSSEWKFYRFNLAQLNHEVDPGEKIVITTNGNFYIDDIRLTEIVDRYYLIKDSWKTPAACNEDINGNPFPLYMLGCDQYQDRDKKNHYLHNFSELCQESAVGCELMIDTHNSVSPQSSAAKGGEVSADNFIYAVYDPDKQCNSADKGCERFGSPYRYGKETIYSDIYLKNDPDQYNEILCEEGAAGCETWISEEGNSYFKDPGDMVCEWRQAAGTGGIGWGWYRRKVKRCNGAGAICLSDVNCASGEECILEEADVKCSSSDLKTFGYGGAGKAVYQPIDNWVGTCPAAQAGCTEFIDPISKPSSVIKYAANDKIILNPSTLYILEVGGISNCTWPLLYKLLPTNVLGSVPTKSINVSKGERAIFFNASKEENNCYVTNNTLGAQVKLAMIEYRLKQDLDKQACNGMVDFEKGCILLNERDQNGSSLASLTWQADLTINDGNGVAPLSGKSNNANQLIKVSPDRICDKWLACRSYIKNADDNPVCFDIGLCNSLDDSGNCNNFIPSSSEPINFTYGDTIQTMALNNLSGYSQVKQGQYYLDKMTQEGEVVELPNGGFELAGKNGYPVGWQGAYTGIWDSGKFKAMFDASEILSELGQNNYPPEGNNILKVSSGLQIVSDAVNLGPGNYTASAYVDTTKLTGTAVIKVLKGWGVLGNINIDSGNRGYVVLKFAVTDRSVIEVALSSENKGGAVYFDDIKIKPVLKTGTDSKTKIDQYTIQSCRLYPKEDSLSCDYFDSSSVSRKGLTGYCLEYDRYPGSSDACLLWYPVDKVRGESVEEGAGYKGKFPLYYCTGLTSGTKLRVKGVADDKFSLYIDGDFIFSGSRNGDYKEKITDKVYKAGRHVIVLTGYNGINGEGYVVASVESTNSAYTRRMITSIDEKYGWRCAVLDGYNAKIIHSLDYDYSDLTWVKPFHISDSASIDEAAGIWPSSEHLNETNVVCRTIIEIAPVCEKFVQTVSATGDNKVYQERLSGGDSNFSIKVNENVVGYLAEATYNSDAAPFGTIVYPSPAANPYEWDSRTDEGIQPIYYSQDKNLPRMGQLHTDAQLQNIFAQSYGGYRLIYGTCSNSSDQDSNGQPCLVEKICVGGKCVRSGAAVYTCNNKSENYLQECSQEASCPGQCLFNNELGLYTCGGSSQGALCCIPRSDAKAGDEICEFDINNQHYSCVGGLNQGQICSSAEVGFCPDGGCEGYGRYIVDSSSNNWNPPTSLCPGNPPVRSDTNICGIPPMISNIKAEKSISKAEIIKNGFVSLTFNTTVDKEQLPLAEYRVDWGDGEETVVSGAEMNHRPNPDNPHEVYHLYSYGDLKNKDAASASITCSKDAGGIGYCSLAPKIKIKDNWGWCNGGPACNQWISFGGKIVVKER